MTTFYMPMADIQSSVTSLMTESGPFAKAILLILFVISVVSWAIIWDRTRLYMRLRKTGLLARRDIRKQSLEGMFSDLGRYFPSVEGALLKEARDFLADEGSSRARSASRNVVSSSGVGLARLREALERRAVEEISEMEKYLVFLATTSGVAPFLGLMGTVWGIMSSFLSMGVHGTASIEVVGPGIAEALVTTIAGLGAAIPALVGYNLLGRHVRRQETRIDLFISRIVESAAGGSEAGVASSEAEYEKNSI